jgi:alpha-glucoside transport system permease protein
VVLGLAVAVLADRLRPRSEKVAKTIIFLPMAISMVGAATIWRFVYEARPAGEPQIGLQNAIVTALGFDPVVWLQQEKFHLNSFWLMIILIWAQVGFSMVLLSAAVKSVPTETLEAARIDGANERQAFFRVVVPQIWPTVLTVFITVLIGVMKVFDIVYVMTNGNFNTNVVGLEFYNQLFTNGNAGYAAAIVVLLMLAIVPVMIYQVRQFRAQEAAR